jgi:hypothetical protein
MGATSRAERDIDVPPTDRSFLRQVEVLLAEPADEWDDGALEVRVTDAAGEHTASSVEEAWGALESHGQGEIEAAAVTATGSGGLRCAVTARSSGPGRVVAIAPSQETADELVGEVERIARQAASHSDTVPAGDSAEAEPAQDAEGSEVAGSSDSELPSATATVVAIGVLLTVLGVIVVVSDQPARQLLLNPWFVTLGGGLLTIFVAWLVKRVASRSRDD